MFEDNDMTPGNELKCYPPLFISIKLQNFPLFTSYSSYSALLSFTTFVTIRTPPPSLMDHKDLTSCVLQFWTCRPHFICCYVPSTCWSSMNQWRLLVFMGSGSEIDTPDLSYVCSCHNIGTSCSGDIYALLRLESQLICSRNCDYLASQSYFQKIL